MVKRLWLPYLTYWMKIPGVMTVFLWRKHVTHWKNWNLGRVIYENSGWETYPKWLKGPIPKAAAFSHSLPPTQVMIMSFLRYVCLQICCFSLSPVLWWSGFNGNRARSGITCYSRCRIKLPYKLSFISY